MWESRDLVGTDAVESTRVMRERLWVENRCVQLTWAHTLLNESKALEGDDWLSQKSASNYPLMKAFTSISVMTRVVKTSNLSRTWHLEPHKKVLHTEPFLSAWLSYSMELAGGGGFLLANIVTKHSLIPTRFTPSYEHISLCSALGKIAQ